MLNMEGEIKFKRIKYHLTKNQKLLVCISFIMIIDFKYHYWKQLVNYKKYFNSFYFLVYYFSSLSTWKQWKIEGKEISIYLEF